MAPAATRVRFPAPTSARRPDNRASRICLVSQVRMSGTKLVPDFRVILGALIGVLDHQRDRRSRGHLTPLGMRHHAGQNFDRIGLLTLGVKRIVPAGGVEIVLDVRIGQRIRGGQPSTTQPIAIPWLSPKVVIRNRWPKVLWDIWSSKSPDWPVW